MKKPLVILAHASLLITLGAPTFAQDLRLQQQLRNATRVDCHFSARAVGTWDDAGAEIEASPAAFEASFFGIDIEGGTAEAEGRFGDSYIVVRFAEGYLHFMQTLTAGPLYLTTVFAEPTAEGRFKAVHTRHEYTSVSLPGFTSRPEMYVGDCALTAADSRQAALPNQREQQ